MSALRFLYRRSLRNKIYRWLHQPSRLLTSLPVFLFYAYLAYLQFRKPAVEAEGMSAWLNVHLFPLLFLLFSISQVISIHGAPKRGASLFFPRDRHFLFVSPFRQGSLFLFALLRAQGTNLFLTALFLPLACLPLGRRLRGLNRGEVLLCLAFLLLFLLFLQAQRIALYLAGKTSRGRLIRRLYFCLALLFCLFPALPLFSPLQPAWAWSLLSPVGWIRLLLLGPALPRLLGFLLYAGTLLLLLLFIQKAHVFFFEDAARAMPENLRLQLHKKAEKKGFFHPSLFGQGATLLFSHPWMSWWRRRRLPWQLPSLLYLTALALPLLLPRFLNPSPFLRSPGRLAFFFLLLLLTFSGLIGAQQEDWQLPFLYLLPASRWKKLVYLFLSSFSQTAWNLLPALLFAGIVYRPGWLEVLLILDLLPLTYFFAYSLEGIHLLLKTHPSVWLKALHPFLFFFTYFPLLLFFLFFFSKTGQEANPWLLASLLLAEHLLAVLFFSLQLRRFRELPNQKER